MKAYQVNESEGWRGWENQEGFPKPGLEEREGDRGRLGGLTWWLSSTFGLRLRLRVRGFVVCFGGCFKA